MSMHDAYFHVCTRRTAADPIAIYRITRIKRIWPCFRFISEDQLWKHFSMWKLWIRYKSSFYLSHDHHCNHEWHYYSIIYTSICMWWSSERKHMLPSLSGDCKHTHTNARSKWTCECGCAALCDLRRVRNSIRYDILKIASHKHAHTLMNQAKQRHARDDDDNDATIMMMSMSMTMNEQYKVRG